MRRAALGARESVRRAHTLALQREVDQPRGRSVDRHGDACRGDDAAPPADHKRAPRWSRMVEPGSLAAGAAGEHEEAVVSPRGLHALQISVRSPPAVPEHGEGVVKCQGADRTRRIFYASNSASAHEQRARACEVVGQGEDTPATLGAKSVPAGTTSDEAGQRPASAFAARAPGATRGRSWRLDRRRWRRRTAPSSRAPVDGRSAIDRRLSPQGDRICLRVKAFARNRAEPSAPLPEVN